jgi:Uma2 family endonuclease
LVVEIVSLSTSRRDYVQKRQLYVDAGVAEYWIVDPERREIRSVRPGEKDRVMGDRIEWSPPRVDGSLAVEIADVFGPSESNA